MKIDAIGRVRCVAYLFRLDDSGGFLEEIIAMQYTSSTNWFLAFMPYVSLSFLMLVKENGPVGHVSSAVINLNFKRDW
jgi:hypothetical protein